MKYHTGCHGNINYLIIPHHIYIYIAFEFYICFLLSQFVYISVCIFVIGFTMYTYNMYVCIHDTGWQNIMSTVILKKYITNKLEVVM